MLKNAFAAGAPTRPRWGGSSVPQSP